jgi:type I restriction enzyme M protein
MPAPTRKSASASGLSITISLRQCSTCPKTSSTTPPPRALCLFLNKAKAKERARRVLLVNASQIFAKGDPKNFIPDEGIQRIAETYRPIAEIVEELNAIEQEARESDEALRKILKQLGVGG